MENERREASKRFKKNGVRPRPIHDNMQTSEES